MRVLLLLRSRAALLTARRQLRQRRLNVLVVELHVTCSPPRGHTPSRKRTHPQPLRVPMRLPLHLSCRPSPAIRRRPALLVRTRGSAAAPSVALGAMRHGSGAYAHA